MSYRLAYVVGIAAVAIPAPPGRCDPPASAPAAGYLEGFMRETEILRVNGAASCSGPACHARTPREGEATLGIEYPLWDQRGNGNHARAYKALLGERSRVMAELLYGKGADPTKRAECLSCHALSVPASRVSNPRYDVVDGVQCESCHGPSQAYFQDHQVADLWKKLTPAQKRAKGMYDTRDLVHRAELCLSCHLGSDGREVTHAMYAAGHPELNFELAGDMFEIPKHWRDAPSLLADETPAAFQARTWAVGQAVSMRESARQLVKWAAGKAAPDFAMFECYACHHDLSAQPPTWRQQRKRTDAASQSAGLGQPRWRNARWAAGRGLAQAFGAQQGMRLMSGMETIGNSLQLDGSRRADVRAAAMDVLATADELAQKLAVTRFDETAIADAMRRLFEDRMQLSRLDYRDAEQVARAAFALRLLRYQPEKPPAGDAMCTSIMELQRVLAGEGTAQGVQKYDPERFGEAASKVAEHGTGGKR